MRQAVGAFSGSSITADEAIRWGWFAQAAASALWDDDDWRAMLLRQVQLARDVGALDQLPIMLAALGTAVVWCGDFAGAASLIAEADGQRGDRDPGRPVHRHTARVLAGPGGRSRPR